MNKIINLKDKLNYQATPITLKRHQKAIRNNFMHSRKIHKR